MKQTFLLLFLLTSLLSFSQKKLDKLLKTHNTESIPYIFPEDLKNESSSYTLLDSREPHEFKVSHLKNAICVGYDFFNLDSIASQLPAKDSKIIVYCSLGIRSEDVAEKLKAAGYTNVHNLYGGIFEWKNNDFTIYNEEETETEDVHTFSKEWSKWLKKGNKIYE